MPVTTFKPAGQVDAGFGYYTYYYSQGTYGYLFGTTTDVTNGLFTNKVSNWSTTTFVPFPPPSKLHKNRGNASSWIRFGGITIPAGATINSATIRVLVVNSNSINTLRFNAKDAASPTVGYLTKFSHVNTPTGLVANPTPADYNLSPVTYTTWQSFGAAGFIKDIVEALIGSYGPYTNGDMLFFLRMPNMEYPTKPVSPALSFRGDGSIPYGFGTPANAPQLVIDYTPAVSPPSKATTPDPTHGAVDVPVDKVLSWVDGGGATSYDVYFGTNPIPSDFKGNQPGTTYDPDLQENTKYYWRIDAKNAGGTTPGDVWSFDTVEGRRPDKTSYRYG